jgi:predicted nucleic acid-binding protein
MTSTLVDSNVLIDLFQPGSRWFEWSRKRLNDARFDGDVIINIIVAAEVAMEFKTEEKLRIALDATFLVKEEIPWQAASRAGAAHREYGLSGGQREGTLPDFLIGAHAIVQQHRLLTRVARRYRSYFPNLDIIAPDTLP